MAMYTIELRTLINEYGYKIFDNYAFYTDDAKLKADFEKLFIETFYFHEIGCETPDRFKWMLTAKLNRIMPYYAQLYQTEWYRVGKDMMNSKDLIETTTHTLTSHQLGSQEQQATSDSNSQTEGIGSETSEISSQSEGSVEETNEAHAQSEGSVEETNEAHAQSEGSGEGTTNSTELESALENGVPQVHLETDLTRKTQTNSTSSNSSEATSQSDSTSSNSSQSTSQSDSTSSNSSQSTSQSDSSSSTSTQATSSNHASNESTLTNQQQNQLEEITTFTSKGDIGIQTPAYAITEWRKVLININAMILNECEDLFMKIY